MDELNEIINQVMSNPESMQQIQAIASSLGLGGDTASQQPPAVSTPQTQPPPQPQQNAGGFDLSALSSLLGNMGQQANPPPQQNPQNSGGFDLSALSSLLGNLNQQPSPPPQPAAAPDLSMLASLLGGLGQQPQPAPAPNLSSLSGLAGLAGLAGGNQQQAGGLDLSAITALLNGGNTPARQPGGILPNIDLGTIMKLANALSSIQANKSNIDLLLALKPRLKEARAKKVDDAIRVMQLIQFLPLIKESGLFGEMDKILGGISGGGLGGLLGNVGNGIGGLLGGLGRR